jgi:hypothetical protein
VAELMAMESYYWPSKEMLVTGNVYFGQGTGNK